jgi:hypothetical protein
MQMRSAVLVAVAASGMLTLGVVPLGAASVKQRSASSTATDLSAQAQRTTSKPRTRIRVRPLYPYRTFSTPYPTPYPYEYPGPNAVRQCTAWLATEYRPSGTVIVPRTRCWWEQG